MDHPACGRTLQAGRLDGAASAHKGVGIVLLTATQALPSTHWST